MSKEDELVRQHRHLVGIVLRHFRARMPRHTSFADLEAAGLAGLLDAIRRNDGHGDFEHYAKRRIKGAMRDELRRLDWVNRRARQQLRAEGGPVRVVTEYDEALHGHHEAQDEAEAIDLRRMLDGLPPAWRYVLEHLLRGEKIKDIAASLGVSSPRVVQIRAAALKALRRP